MVCLDVSQQRLPTWILPSEGIVFIVQHSKAGRLAKWKLWIKFHFTTVPLKLKRFSCRQWTVMKVYEMIISRWTMHEYCAWWQHTQKKHGIEQDLLPDCQNGHANKNTRMTFFVARSPATSSVVWNWWSRLVTPDIFLVIMLLKAVGHFRKENKCQASID